MDKNNIKLHIIIPVLLAIILSLITIIVYSNKQINDEALAETITTDTEYSITFPAGEIIESVQDRRPVDNVNKNIALSDAFYVLIEDYFEEPLEGFYVTIKIYTNREIYYILDFGGESLHINFILNNNYNAPASQDIIYYLDDSPVWSLKDGNFDSVQITFTSLTPTTQLTQYQELCFNRFLQDIYNLSGQEPIQPPAHITINEGLYILNKNILEDLTQEPLTLDLNHKILTPLLSSADTTGQRGYDIQFNSSPQRTRILWNTHASHPNTMLSDNNELYRRLNEVGQLAYYIIKVETTQQVNDNIISQALTPIPAENIMSFWLWKFGADYNAAYNTGYDAGMNDNIVSDNVTGVITAIFSGLFGSIFAVEIFPGFPLYIFILIPVVFGVIGLVLWLVRGK